MDKFTLIQGGGRDKRDMHSTMLALGSEARAAAWKPSGASSGTEWPELSTCVRRASGITSSIRAPSPF